VRANSILGVVYVFVKDYSEITVDKSADEAAQVWTATCSLVIILSLISLFKFLRTEFLRVPFLEGKVIFLAFDLLGNDGCL
jgi:hypothetical protein